MNVHIVNRLGNNASQDILIANDVLTHTEFQQNHTNGLMISQNALASPDIRLQDIVLPVTYINMVPSDEDQWTFDFLVTYFFSNGMNFSSRTNGITLDQNYHKTMLPYQGSSFPVSTPPGKPHSNVSDHTVRRKHIPMTLLKKKLDEFINNRQGLGNQDPPMWKIHLDNSGIFGDTLPESYYDLESIVAFPPRQFSMRPPVFGRAFATTAAQTH